MALSVGGLSPSQNMLNFINKLEDKDEFDLMFEDGLKATDGDILKEMLKDSDTFFIGNK